MQYILRMALLVGLLSPSAWAESRFALEVDGLACPFCAYGIEKQLSRIEGVARVDTDIESGRVVVTTDDGTPLNEESAREAVTAAGFALRSFSRLQETAQ